MPGNARRRSVGARRAPNKEEDEVEDVPKVAEPESSRETMPNNMAAPLIPDAGPNPVLLVNADPRKRWDGWRRRGFFTTLMLIIFFGWVYFLRHTGVLLLIVGLQIAVYRELVLISIRSNEEQKMPTFKSFYYGWFLSTAYYFYMRLFQHRFELLFQGSVLTGWSKTLFDVFVTNHATVAFSLYALLFVLFVLSLRRGRLSYQLSQFGFCHMALMIVVVQSTYMSVNVFNGLIWYLLPASLVIMNDVAAYMVGFHFGKTRLIALSPKKTVEGFVGAFIITLIFAFFYTALLERIDWLGINKLVLCPPVGFQAQDSCDLQSLYGGIHIPVPLNEWAGTTLPLIGTWTVSAVQWHSLIMAVFASTIAPFGGFFASAIKRAFQIKDFGNLIPGHGGLTDRMDCQLIMGSFAWFYAHHILQMATPGELGAEKLFEQYMDLEPGEQTQFMELLQGSG